MSDIAIKLHPAISLAAQKALKHGLDGKARDNIEPGSYQDVSLTLTIRASEVRVGQDYERAATGSIPLLPTLALLLKRMGFQREEALAQLQEVMTEVITMGVDAREALLKEQGVSEMMELLQEKIADLPKTKVRGPVTLVKPEVTIRSASIK